MTRARQTAAIAIAAALLAAAAGTAAVMARPDWLFGVPPHAAAAAPKDALAELPGDLAAMLVEPKLDAPTAFMRLTRVKPEAFCKGLARLGLKNPVYQGGAPLRGWSCLTDLMKPIDGDETRVSSLFVAARGLESDRIENLRMKLNLLDPATAPLVKAMARDALTEICRGFGWDPPPEALAAIDELKEGRLFDRGVSYDLRKEFGPGLRLNLIIIFPRLLGTGGEARFVTDARRAPVAQ